MRNIRLVIAYEGTAYLGWQETQEGPSIEGTLRQALERLLQHTVVLQAASRTDVGVHAAGQVVNFFTASAQWEPQRLQRALNGVLPHDIVIKEVTEAPEAFHPTLDTTGKEYHYHVCYGTVQLPHLRHVSWHVHHSLNFDAMQQAVDKLQGGHDFKAFCNHRKQLHYTDYVRTVRRFVFERIDDDRLRFEVEGCHFLYKMVRNLVGTVVDAGKGRIPVDQLDAILASGDRRQAGVTAPAHGLILYRVNY